jgi:hypothetical protein
LDLSFIPYTKELRYQFQVDVNLPKREKHHNFYVLNEPEKDQ